MPTRYQVLGPVPGMGARYDAVESSGRARIDVQHASQFQNNIHVDWSTRATSTSKTYSARHKVYHKYNCTRILNRG